MSLEIGYKGGGYDPYNSATTSKRWLNARYGAFVRGTAAGIATLLFAVLFRR